MKSRQDAIRYEVGTLGGGNHFIELQKDEEGTLWIMIHSGSRNLGKQVGDYYNKLAASLNWRKRSIPTHSGWLYPLTFDAGKGLKEA